MVNSFRETCREYNSLLLILFNNKSDTDDVMSTKG